MKSEDVPIGSHTYRISKLPASVGLQTAAKLANALAPSLKNLPSEGFALKAGEEGMAQLMVILEPLLSNPQLGGTLSALCQTFAAHTLLVGTKTTREGEVVPYQMPLERVFDEHFSDAYDDMILWLGHCLRVSMTSFFRGVSELGASIPRVATASKSPS